MKFFTALEITRLLPLAARPPPQPPCLSQTPALSFSFRVMPSDADARSARAERLGEAELIKKNGCKVSGSLDCCWVFANKSCPVLVRKKGWSEVLALLLIFVPVQLEEFDGELGVVQGRTSGPDV